MRRKNEIWAIYRYGKLWMLPAENTRKTRDDVIRMMGRVSRTSWEELKNRGFTCEKATVSRGWAKEKAAT